MLAAGGIYLVYAGIRDVPVIDGLRDLLRGTRPTERAGQSYGGPTPDEVFGGLGSQLAAATGANANDLGLVGSAALAYPILRASFPDLEMLGRGERPNNPSSDHPHGAAIDVMTTNDATAQRVIRLFKGTVGAHYWIWNRRIGDVDQLWASRPYSGDSPHTDHVHLSWRRG